MKKFKVSNLIFILIVMAALCAGLVRTFISPLDINEYENRTAEKLTALSLDTYADGSFQDSVELALGDQIFYAVELKQGYNNILGKYTSSLLMPLIEKENSKYAEESQDDPAEEEEKTEDSQGAETADTATGGGIETQDTTSGSSIEIADNTTGSAVSSSEGAVTKDSTGSAISENEEKKTETDTEEIKKTSGEKYVKVTSVLNLYKGHLLYGAVGMPDSRKEKLQTKADNINSLAETHPDISFYVFYAEKDTDKNFVTGYSPKIGDYLCDLLTLPQSNKHIFRVGEWEDFDSEFYRTDHHWNYKGSYRAYTECLEMLLPGEEPLQPLEELYMGKSKGSRTQDAATSSYQEDFYVYVFDFPEFKYYSALTEMEAEYGRQTEMINQVKSGKTYSQITYGSFYGWDDGLLEIDNQEDTGNGNILVFGSSYDNAILKLLASHYDKLYDVDLRNFDSAMGYYFRLAKFVEEYNITTVLFFGDSAFFEGQTFIVHDK